MSFKVSRYQIIFWNWLGVDRFVADCARTATFGHIAHIAVALDEVL
jgi:hypothetical protein